MLNRFTRRLAFEARDFPVRMRDRLLSSLPEDYKYRRGVISTGGSIRNMRENGFCPTLIVDIGAYHGAWSKMARDIYPNVPICMVEANPETESILSAATGEIGRAEYHVALLGPRAASSVRFYAMEIGSSVLPETTSLPRSMAQLPMTTLDTLVLARERLPGPYFLKLDVQGFELEVLRGAEQVLGSTEAVLLEASLMEYNQGAPLLAEVVAFMRSRNFVVYDICGFNRRESDSALYMIDLLFVRESSALRARKRFWNVEASFETERAS